MKKENKVLWIIIGIAVGIIIAMLGMLAYNKYVDNKEDNNNKTEEKENNNQENIDLTGYTEIDISKNNVFPIYKRYEKNSFAYKLSNEASYEGKFIIENNKLYLDINNEKYLMNIEEPKKAVIVYYGMAGEHILMVLTKSGELYFTCLYSYDEDIEKVVNQANNDIKKYYDFSDIDDISVILNIHGSTWEDIYFTYNKNNEEMVIRSESLYELENHPAFGIDKLSVDLGPVSVKADKTAYDSYGNKLNIKPKYLLDYIPEVGHGAFLDEDNYLYVSTSANIDENNKGKIINAYKSELGKIVVRFENGTLKYLSDYEEF